MKKRAKLITTIASLCLAVALLAFGVYAATTATLTVSSQIRFEVQDVFVSVWGTARLVPGTGAEPVALTPYASAENPAKSYTTNSGVTEAAEDSGDLGDWNILTVGDTPVVPQFDNDHETVEYVLHIRNDSNETVYVSLTDQENPAGTNLLPYVAGTTIDVTAKINNVDAARDTTELNVVNATLPSANPANAVTFSGIDLAAGQVLDITLTRTLTDHSTTFAATTSLSVKLTVSLTDPTPATQQP